VGISAVKNQMSVSFFLFINIFSTSHSDIRASLTVVHGSTMQGL